MLPPFPLHHVKSVKMTSGAVLQQDGRLIASSCKGEVLQEIQSQNANIAEAPVAAGP